MPLTDTAVRNAKLGLTPRAARPTSRTRWGTEAGLEPDRNGFLRLLDGDHDFALLLAEDRLTLGHNRRRQSFFRRWRCPYLPYEDGTFRRTLSMLALDVLPDSYVGLKEMQRVTCQAGTVAVVVNNFRCGWTPFSMVWDVAAVLDPAGGAMRDEMVSKPLSWPGGLARMFSAAGLADVVEEQLSVIVGYRSFDNYWSSFMTGQGKTGSYVMNLSAPRRGNLESHVRAAYLCGMPDGPRDLTTLFWAVRGKVPELRL